MSRTKKPQLEDTNPEAAAAIQKAKAKEEVPLVSAAEEQNTKFHNHGLRRARLKAENLVAAAKTARLEVETLKIENPRQYAKNAGAHEQRVALAEQNARFAVEGYEAAKGLNPNEAPDKEELENLVEDLTGNGEETPDESDAPAIEVPDTTASGDKEKELL